MIRSTIIEILPVHYRAFHHRDWRIGIRTSSNFRIYSLERKGWVAFDEVSIHPTFFRSLVSRPWISHSGKRVDRCAITYSRIRGDDLSSSVRSLDPLADRDIHRINRFLNSFFSLIPPIIPYPPEFFRDLVSFEDHDNTSDFLPQDGRKKLKDEIEIRDDWNDLSKMRIIGEKKWFFIPSSIRNIERQEAH